MLNSINPRVVIEPQILDDDTPAVSDIVDRKGYNSLVFLIGVGTLNDPDVTFAVTMRVGDVSNLSDGVAVPAGDLVGTLALAAFTFADSGASRKIEYIGSKRYVELTITPTGNDLMSGDMVPVPIASAPVCAFAVLGSPAFEPTPNPPV